MEKYKDDVISSGGTPLTFYAHFRFDETPMRCSVASTIVCHTHDGKMELGDGAMQDSQLRPLYDVISGSSFTEDSVGTKLLQL